MIDERTKKFDGARRPPLFKVTFSLQNVDVVVQPPMTEVNKALGRLVRSLVESTKMFVRWMDGTCIETPEQRGATDDDEPIVFTFYWDVAANPQVGTDTGSIVPTACCCLNLVPWHSVPFQRPRRRGLESN